MANDSKLTRLAEFEPVLVPVFLQYHASDSRETPSVLRFHLRLSNNGRGMAYSVRPVLVLPGSEQREGKPPIRWAMRTGPMGASTQAETDRRPMSPASDAVPGGSYEDFHFTFPHGDPVPDDTLDFGALNLSENKVALRVGYMTTFGKGYFLAAEFGWNVDRLELCGLPKTKYSGPRDNEGANADIQRQRRRG